MPDFLYEKKGQIAYMTLNRPQKLNALSEEMVKGMESAFTDLQNDPELKVGIITGAGDRAFSTGADLDMLSQFHNSAELRAQRFWQTFSHSPLPFREVGAIWKPMIAAVNGFAIGGGLELALVCDIIIASENASFSVPEVALGAVPSAGATQRLTRRVPFGAALEMLLTGDRISAQEAYRIGLANKVVTLPQLMPAAEELAKKIAGGSLHSLMVIKELAWRGLSMPLAEGLRMEKMYSRILREDPEQRKRIEEMLSKLKKR